MLSYPLTIAQSTTDIQQRTNVAAVCKTPAKFASMSHCSVNTLASASTPPAPALTVRLTADKAAAGGRASRPRLPFQEHREYPSPHQVKAPVAAARAFKRAPAAGPPRIRRPCAAARGGLPLLSWLRLKHLLVVPRAGQASSPPAGPGHGARYAWVWAHSEVCTEPCDPELSLIPASMHAALPVCT